MNEVEVKKILNLEYEKSNINQGDLVLFHSSLRRVLKKIKLEFDFEATPEIVFNSLLERLTEKGTLVLPLFNFDFTTTKKFNIQSTASQMGALTELGRLHPNAVRTGHPIYSFVAIGHDAYNFRNINNYSGYGADSPFGMIKKLSGKIAVIGLDDQNSMTSYHYVEEMCNVDYRYHKKFIGEYVDCDGNISQKEYSLFVRDLDRGVQTDVNRMGELLWKKNLYQGSRFEDGFGIRSIDFNDFYNAVAEVINTNQAENFLYSIKK